MNTPNPVEASTSTPDASTAPDQPTAAAECTPSPDCLCRDECEFAPRPSAPAVSGEEADKARAIDLGGLIRDWRLTDCEHRISMDREACCAPCLRDRLIASEWFAKSLKSAKAQALREAAAEVDLDMGIGHDMADDARATTAAQQWLLERADCIGGAS